MIPQEHYDEELRRVADRLAYEYGLTTTFVTGAILIEDARGETFKARGVYTGQGVILQADCKESVTSLAAHELFHDRAAHDSGLVDAAWRELVRQYGPAEMRKLLRDYTIRLRGEISVDEYSDAAALDEAGLRIAEEICADAYAKMNAFGLGAYQYSKTVRRAMNERADAGRQQNGERETRGPPRQQYSVNSDFNDELQTWYNRTKPDRRATSHGYFRIGTTSEALRSIGARADNIYMRKYKIGTILEDHPDVDIDIIKQVPEILENPILIMKSRTQPDSIVLFGDVKANNGDTVMAALQLTPQPGGNTEAEFSLVTSAYDRTDTSIRNLINNSELLYLNPNKNRTNNWLMQLRVQFPSGQPPFGSIGSISYAEDGVKITGKTLQELGGTINAKASGPVLEAESSRIDSNAVADLRNKARGNGPSSEAESLVVSNDTSGSVYPAYPAELQPRNRGRQQNGERETKGPPEERYSSEADGDGSSPRFVVLDHADTAQIEQRMADAYDKAMEEGRGVTIDNATLKKYGDISNDPEKSLIAAVKDYYDHALKGVSVNVHMTGGIVTIMFENDGKRKSVGWRMKADKAATFERLRDLTENAIYAYSEENRDPVERTSIPLFHYFVNNINLGGTKNVPVKIQTRDILTGERPGTHYYTHILDNNKAKTSGPVSGAESPRIDSNAKTDLREEENRKSSYEQNGSSNDSITEESEFDNTKFSVDDDEERASADTGLRLPPPPGSGDFTDGGETVYTERERLDRAAALVRSRAEPSEVYNATGFVKMANGSLVDPESGTVVWREENDTGRSQEYVDGVEIGGQTQAGVSENDGRGVSGLSGGKDRTFLRQGWETLVHAEQRIAERIIVNHLLENQNDLTDLILAEYEGEETALSEKIYRLYAQGNIVFEREAGQFMLDPDGLADRLDEALGEAEERYSRDDEDKARISNLDSLFASAPSERRSGAFQSSC